MGSPVNLWSMLELARRPRLPSVAVVASDRRLRESLSSVLAATGRVDVIGSAADSLAALRLARSGHADVVLVDPILGADGRLLASLRRRAPAARILLVDWDGPSRSVRAPDVDGVLDATSMPAALFEALAAVPLASD